MSDRHPALLNKPVRHPVAVLEENAGFYKDLYDQAKARLTVEGQNEMHGKIEKAIAQFEASGQPGLLSQMTPNYIRSEALVRTFATGFGIVVGEGSADQVPEYTLPELTPTNVKILTVAVTEAAGQARRRVIYDVQETQSKGAWKEIQTEPAHIRRINPYFTRKRAVVEAEVADKLAYFLTKELDNLVWAFINVSGAKSILKSSFTGQKVWTFKDMDIAGLPNSNKGTSSASFWKTLRTNVIPYFQGIGKADAVINIHLNHMDLQYLFQVAPLGATLGGYSQFQTAVYEGNIQDISIYGHRFRIIPQNWLIASASMYCNVGPVFKMWLPAEGEVQVITNNPDGSQDRLLSQVYEILSPSPWWPNLYYTTWSTTDTSG